MNVRESNEQTPPMLAIVFIVLSATEEWNSLLCIKRIKGGWGEEVGRKEDDWADPGLSLILVVWDKMTQTQTRKKTRPQNPH